MRKSLELKQKAEAVYLSAKSMLAKIDAEKRDPSDAEILELKGMNDQVDGLKAKAQQYERMENHDAGRASSPEVPETPLEDEDPKPAERKGPKVFATLGHQMQAIYAKATGRIPSGYASMEEVHNKLQAAATGQGEAVDSDGGSVLQSDFSSDIEQRMHSVGTVLSLITPIGVSGNRLVERYIDEQSRATGSRWGSVRGYWVSEGSSITASTAKFAKREIELEKVAALGYASNELLEDFPAMSGIFNEGFAEELVFLTEDAIIEGNGNGKPLGISIAPCFIGVTKETNQAAATILVRNLSNMWVRLPSASKSKAVWLINTECNPQLDDLTIVAGTAGIEPRFVNYGPDGILRIKGRPVIEVEYCSALGTQGDILLADFSQYRLITKGGVKQDSSIHVRFVNDETAFRATYRVGGQPKPKTTITPFKGSATLSPFVGLATRS